jgi:HTH-type transcriptional regulator/antitoxin HipB
MKSSNLKSFRDHLDEQYGKVGTKSRTEYEEGFEAFKLGMMLQDLRTKEGMTQEELANKCGTTKSYISRIENNASDIRLSTIMKIFREGFGKQIKLSVN